MNKTLFIFIRDMTIAVFGVWYFEFSLDFQLPSENNLLLFFVAIPVIWATLMQLWISVSYREQDNRIMYVASHVLGVLMLISSVFLISAVLNTIESSLDPMGNVLFHFVGWTGLLAVIFYDMVDISR
ncbi:hypothetical protein [Marispirochaeta aestuarii]|uniref:hypothetical protein n=1 Tax=Marispirochaeta aestuarii TaxID=1963862 RepID=UPI0018E99E94|nr:hypothetical protein [Marispirochaeta aestuarii]